jgi:serine/threonine-protein kinase RsbW
MLKPDAPDTIRLSLPSRLELLAVLDRLAAMLCERMEFDEDASAQVTMSVIEAGTNAIQHGHHRDASKSFDVVFELRPDRLEVTVHDTGTGFDLGDIDGDVTAPERLFEPRGRGIYIMRACMDAVDFRFESSGTYCHLVKHRRAVSAATG